MANKVKTLVASCQVNSSAAKFYEIFKNKPSELASIFPAKFKEIQVVEGEAGEEGCITLWTHVVGDNIVTVKAKVEEIDDVARSVTYTVIEGELLKLYKSFKFVNDFTDGLAKLTIVYEKATLISPPPELYNPLAVALYTHMDAYFLANN